MNCPYRNCLEIAMQKTDLVNAWSYASANPDEIVGAASRNENRAIDRQEAA
jgi:hypothetical protein